MDSASIITSMDSPLQHLRSVRAKDLPPNQQACHVCGTPWGSPIEDVNGPMEYPVVLTCGCIAGSLCLERSFENSPRCPLCNTTIRIIAGVNAPLNQNTGTHLRQLELRSGVNDWPIPSIESRQERPDRVKTEESEQMKCLLQEKLGVLNGCHDTFLSIQELEICISLVDYRLGTTTPIVDVLDAFLKYPLFDPSRWKRTADIREYMEGKSKNFFQGKSGCENLTDGDLRDALMLVNMRAGTSFLLDELELVVSLMNFIHASDVGLLDVLGLRDRGVYGQRDLPGLQAVDNELVGAFRTLDIRVGSKNAVEDLGDVFSQANL
ncbi:MAG: hypothetical protein Q9161_006605 [Pseudevernia consocians]